MTETSTATPSTASFVVTRLADRWTAVSSIVGGSAVIAGVALPWLSTLAGLQTLTGMDGTNGRALAVGGALAVALGAANLRPMPQPVRRAAGLLGFALLAWSSWLLLALLLAYRELSADPFALAQLGSGLFVATAGAAVVFAPMLRRADEGGTASPAVRRSSRLAVVLAASSLLAGVLHLGLAGEHLADSLITAAAFATLGVVQILGAALVILRPTQPTLRAAAAVNAGAILAWALAQAGLLPFLHASASDGHHGMTTLVTVIAEAVAVLLSLRMAILSAR